MGVSLNRAKKELESYDLIKSTEEIKGHFTNFLAQLQQHMLVLQKEGAIDVSVIKNQIVSYDKKLKAPMSQCKSLQDVFKSLILPEHSSFWDYDLLKVLIDYGSDRIKNAFFDYKKKLQKFFENRMIQHSSGEEKSYAVVVDKSITSEISDLIQLQNRVKMILGHENIGLLHWGNFHPTTDPIVAQQPDETPEKLVHQFNSPSKKDSGEETMAAEMTASESDTLSYCSSKASSPGTTLKLPHTVRPISLPTPIF